MEIILKEDAYKLGRKGDVAKVAGCYGRNFLLPHRLAIAATPANLRNIEQVRASAARREARDRDATLALAAQLALVKLDFERRAGEKDALFGSVTSMDIMHALAERGYDIERRKIDLPDPLKSLGDHSVTLHLFRDVTASLAITIAREATGDEPAADAAPIPEA